MNNLNPSTTTAACAANPGGRSGGIATYGLKGDTRRGFHADYVLAKPHFKASDWFRKGDDVRWQFGVPPKENATVRLFVGKAEPSLVA